MSNNLGDTPINGDLVANYLLAHPDFFNERQDVLRSLTFTHRSGKALSLVERQMVVLRERNEMLEKENKMMRAYAADNEDKLRKTQRLVISLLECNNLEDVGIVLQESLCHDFSSDLMSLKLIDPRAGEGNSYGVFSESQLAEVSSLLQSNVPTCGRLDDSQKQALFDDKAPQVGSLAVAPLVNGETLGVLALGSFDENYFASDDSTLFLSYTADVTSRVVSRFITGSSVTC
ncbi:MAG: DUF484 family protein [Pontibacterium sp.]